MTTIALDLADNFNARYPGLGWTEDDVSQILTTHDPDLESVEEHLECFADHQILTTITTSADV